MVQVLWYPERVAGKRGGYVGEFLDKSGRRRPDLVALVNAFLLKLTQMDNLDGLFLTQQLKPLGQNLIEMRIPKQLRSGVVRVYFCWSRSVKNCAVLLAGEIKQDKESEMIGVAQSRLKDYMSGRL